MNAIIVIYILILVIIGLISLAIIQIRLTGLKVKDFWSFIEANQLLDRLYKFAKKYDKLSTTEQLVFLQEAEKIFAAFDKVPNMLWEEENQKYMEVLEKYRDIKMLRWLNT